MVQSKCSFFQKHLVEVSDITILLIKGLSPHNCSLIFDVFFFSDTIF